MPYISSKGVRSAVAAVLLIGATGATNVRFVDAAGEYVTLSSYSGHAGTAVQVAGGNFAPNTALTIYTGTSAGPAAVSATTAADGSFGPVSITIPATVSGSLAVNVVGGSDATREDASNSFYVQPYSPTVTLSVGSADPYSPVTVSGSGFAPGEAVALSLATATATATADMDGAFAATTLTVPNLEAGTQTVNATGQVSGAIATSYLYVNGFYPSLSPSAYYLLPGQALSFNGSGFARGEKVDVKSGTTTLTSFTAGLDGSFMNAGSVVIPNSAAGTTASYTLTGETSMASAQTSLSVGQFSANVSPSAYYLLPGQDLSFAGTGFAPGENVIVTEGMSTAPIATVIADEDGAFTAGAAMTTSVKDAGTVATFHLKGEQSNAAADVQVTVGQLSATLSPSSYYLLPGATFGATGNGFLSGEEVSLTLNDKVVATATADLLGSVSFAGLVVPNTSATSSLALAATGQTSGAIASTGVALGQYYPYASADNYYVKPGSTVMVTAGSFAPGEKIDVTIGDVATTVTADEMGAVAPFSVVVPFGLSSKTPPTVTLTGKTSMASAKVELTQAPFTPQLSPSTYYAAPGTDIDFAASGFAPGETVTVTNGTATVGTATADKMGAIASFVTALPFGGTSATYTFTGAMSAGSASTTIGVASFYSGIMLDTYYGNGGIANTITGSGFAPNEVVALNWDGASLGTVTADKKGSFVFPTTVPYAAAGDKKITATGQLSGSVATTSFTEALVYVSLQLGTYADAPGSAVTFIGTGYMPGETVNITTDRATGTVYRLTADKNGSFTDAGYVLPADATPGKLTFTATGEHSLNAQSIVYYVTGK